MTKPDIVCVFGADIYRMDPARWCSSTSKVALDDGRGYPNATQGGKRLRDHRDRTRRARDQGILEK